MRLLSSLLQKCKVFTFHEMFSGVWQEISQGPKCTSQIWRCAVIGLSFFRVKKLNFGIWQVTCRLYSPVSIVTRQITPSPPSNQPIKKVNNCVSFLSGILDTPGRYLDNALDYQHSRRDITCKAAIGVNYLYAFLQRR